MKKNYATKIYRTITTALMAVLLFALPVVVNAQSFTAFDGFNDSSLVFAGVMSGSNWANNSWTREVSIGNNSRKVQIVNRNINGRPNLNISGNVLELRGQDAGAYRLIDLSVANTAILNFIYHTNPQFDGDETLLIQIDPENDGTYHTLQSITGVSGGVSSIQNINIPIPAQYLSGSLSRIRFITGDSPVNELRERWWIDNIQVQVNIDPCTDPNGIDTDGDGINDICDSDSDNDGILDVDEGFIKGHINILNNFGVNPDISAANNGSYSTSISGIDATYTFIENNTKITTRNPSYSTQQGPMFSFRGNANDTGSIDIDFSEVVSGSYFKLTDFNSQEELTVEVFDQNNNIIDIQAGGFATLGVNIDMNGNVFTENGTVNGVDGDRIDNDGIGGVIFDFSGQFISRIKVSINHNVTNTAIRFTQVEFHKFLDTDGDGIPDHLDTDSDNDGCPDAIEGNGSYTYTDIDLDSRLTVAIDANGLPNGTSQSIGSSRDNTINVCCYATTSGYPDIDNDGVADICDLDNDNDGILDRDEMRCDLPGVANSNSGTGIYQDKLYFFNWDGTDFNDGLQTGDSQTFNLPDGLVITATFTSVNITGLFGTVTTADMNTWSGAFLHKLYNTAGTKESLYGNASATRIQATLSITATKNGLPFSVDVLALDPEATNGSANESWSVTTNGADWRLLEQYGGGGEWTGAGTNTVTTTNTQQSGGTSIFYSSQTTEMTFDIASPLLARQAFAVGIYFVCELDTDGDGTPDHLDTDSDGDGCPDAVEAAGSFTEIDLTGADNLCDSIGCVDVNGVPLVANGGQANTAAVLDATIKYACNPCIDPAGLDTDGDGINDICDLDSDNDGILDVDEDKNCTGSIVKEYIVNKTFETVVAGQVIPKGSLTGVSGMEGLLAAYNSHPANSGTTNVGEFVSVSGFDGNTTIAIDANGGGIVDKKQMTSFVILDDVNLLAGTRLTVEADFSMGQQSPYPGLGHGNEYGISIGAPNQDPIWGDDYAGAPDGVFMYGHGTPLIRHPNSSLTDFSAPPRIGGWFRQFTTYYVEDNGSGTLHLFADNVGYRYDASGIPETTFTATGVDFGPASNYPWLNNASISLSADEYVDNIVIAINRCDTDGDGIPDYLDLDSDNDGCFDANEAYGNPNADADGNGTYGSGTLTVANGEINSDGTVVQASYAYTPENLNNVKTALRFNPGTTPDAVINVRSGDALVLSSNATADRATAYQTTAPFAPIYGTPGNANAGLQYAWTFNDGTGPVSIGGNSPTLDLGTVSLSDAGEYVLTITHSNHVCANETITSVVTVRRSLLITNPHIYQRVKNN